MHWISMHPFPMTAACIVKIAHAKMLAAHGIISKEDQEKITKGLLSIKKEIDEGTFPFSVELEDIHMNIEKQFHQCNNIVY